MLPRVAHFLRPTFVAIFAVGLLEQQADGVGILQCYGVASPANLTAA